MSTYQTRIVLPLLPPSVNHMYVSIGKGRKALSDEAITFRQEVAIALRAATPPPAKAPLVLNVWLRFGNKRIQDGDNRLKALQDAIALALGFNDSAIVEWHVYAEHGASASCEALLELQQ